MTQPVFRPTASFQQWEKEKLKYSFLHPFYWYDFIIAVLLQNVNQFSTRKNIFVGTAQTQDSIFVHFSKKQVVRTRYKRQPCPDRLYHMGFPWESHKEIEGCNFRILQTWSISETKIRALLLMKKVSAPLLFYHISAWNFLYCITAGWNCQPISNFLWIFTKIQHLFL